MKCFVKGKLIMKYFMKYYKIIMVIIEVINQYKFMNIVD